MATTYYLPQRNKYSTNNVFAPPGGHSSIADGEISALYTFLLHLRDNQASVRIFSLAYEFNTEKNPHLVEGLVVRGIELNKYLKLMCAIYLTNTTEKIRPPLCATITIIPT